MELAYILSSLDDHLTVSNGTLKTLKSIIIGLNEARTVNFQEVCSRFREGKQASNMRKIERFMSSVSLNDDEVIKLIIGLLFSKDEKIMLAIDRTEWEFGTCWHNILCLSVIYKKTAIPLVSLPLERKGNSDSTQRLTLLKRVLSVIPRKKIAAILGDREFIGDEWFRGLKKLNIPFVMRIRDNITVGINDETAKISHFMPKTGDVTLKNVHIGTDIYDLTLKKCTQDDVALVSYGVSNPIAFYKRRWDIETGFKCLKTNGFNLEDTHLKHRARIALLIQICAMAMAMSLHAFEHSDAKKNSKIPSKTMVIDKIQSSHWLNAFL